MKVLLLHAFPLDPRMWEPQQEGLSSYAPSAPGLYGRGQTIDAWAASILAETEGELVPIGASMGGYCALAVARRAPERVPAVALVGSRADADTPERRAGRADTIRQLREDGLEPFWEGIRPKLFSCEADPAVIERARTIMLEQDVEALVGAVEAIRDRPDSTEVARSRPVLVVTGDSDPFVPPEDSRTLSPDAHVLHSGHLVSMERPDEVNRLLHEWLRTIA